MEALFTHFGTHCLISRTVAATACLVFTYLVSGCVAGTPTHRPWPEADALFRREPCFRGSDSAYSADLGGGRVLWLFGDTFVGDVPGSREGSTMVRNSVAIQHGYNPAMARIDFYFGEQDGQPTAFLEDEGPTWIWPGPAIKIDETLLLTFFELELFDGGLGFHAIGSAAFTVVNPDDPPSEWKLKRLELPPIPSGVRFGTGALYLEGEHLFAFMVTEPGSHDLYLARWQASAVASGDLSSPQWFHPENGWGSTHEQLEPIIRNLQTEFSVHRDPESAQLMLISVDGFDASNVVARTADEPEGPWSQPKLVIRPEESDREGLVVYSAKAHPYLSGGETIITYASNNLDFAALVEDMSIYFPRFLRQR